MICFLNGGSEDSQAFYRNTALQSELLAHIRNPGSIDPSRFFTYFINNAFVPWVADGRAVFVNAVAYRSPNARCLTQRNTRDIPSVRIARSWIRERCAEAINGKKLIVFHRWSLWGVAKNEYDNPNIIFSPNQASPYLADVTLKRIKTYLARSP